ncbi:hypothetical protein IJH24_03585 [Candidatus Saccharibacteria bacterium]|nr:hypothetical protein [Candidatus Saccharibacteria bacterium]
MSKDIDYQDRYDQLAEVLNITAREYFKVLQLAIYHETHHNIESSFGVAQYVKTPKIWAKACDILNALYNDEIKEK